MLLPPSQLWRALLRPCNPPGKIRHSRVDRMERMEKMKIRRIVIYFIGI
nr:MAG TPA: hypothetical protein [Caudoviricetes sp.]